MTDTPTDPPGQAPEPDAAPTPRWAALFRHAADPLYLLNRHRQFLFVNRAWEDLTGFPLATVRSARCKRHRDASPASLEALLTVLAPPPEALQGKPARVRRPLPRLGAAPDWWDVAFFPFTGPRGRLCVLGRISPVPRQAVTTGQPLPPRLIVLREKAARAYGVEHLPAESPAQRRLVEQVRLASQVDVPVLLVGEGGTGKQWLARTIHQQGKARERTFALVDCARLSPVALAGVLFGEPGLCRRAYVGTVYLREPARLPRELQARLCELLATPPGRRPRVMAGMSLDPVMEVRNGSLLEELHCALSALTIPLLPLRERRADLPALVQRLLARLNLERDPPLTALAAEAWDVLQRHPWPGNLRELHTVLGNALARVKGERIEAADLPWYLREPGPPPERPLPLKSLLKQVERRLIELALKRTRYNKARAAELLEIWRPQLHQRMKALGIEDREKGKSKKDV